MAGAFSNGRSYIYLSNSRCGVLIEAAIEVARDLATTESEKKSFQTLNDGGMNRRGLVSTSTLMSTFIPLRSTSSGLKHSNRSAGGYFIVSGESKTTKRGRLGSSQTAM
jgi:hypothetical protein